MKHKTHKHSGIAWGPRPMNLELLERNWAIAKLYGEGLATLDELSREFGLSVNHIYSICSKLNVRKPLWAHKTRTTP